MNSQDGEAVAAPVVMIDGWIIKQDAHGRYCLNDVHKASGAHAITSAPSQWVRLSGQSIIQELILGNPSIAPLVSKQRVGTYAVKELVYAYAMWRGRQLRRLPPRVSFEGYPCGWLSLIPVLSR
ncbi:KilA-N domain-containing protein [Pseudomonas sp. UBA2684]|uniref:KilA-N domain-containing protein n=1 Tax=Pseudomonas sp. UBA2684 TaxID=1947311 RepID=UPI000E837676|nr:hypothetical protein [Pseudomonas sp.]|tara:strand:+ start:345 stop:716 length:372 start_codon:yes stop_codon:yes gene_type:complete